MKLMLRLRLKWERYVNLWLRLKIAYLQWEQACLKSDLALQQALRSATEPQNDAGGKNG